jgi:hypothetical protein
MVANEYLGLIQMVPTFEGSFEKGFHTYKLIFELTPSFRFFRECVDFQLLANYDGVSTLKADAYYLYGQNKDMIMAIYQPRELDAVCSKSVYRKWVQGNGTSEFLNITSYECDFTLTLTEKNPSINRRVLTSAPTSLNKHFWMLINKTGPSYSTSMSPFSCPPPGEITWYDGVKYCNLCLKDCPSCHSAYNSGACILFEDTVQYTDMASGYWQFNPLADPNDFGI